MALKVKIERIQYPFSKTDVIQDVSIDLRPGDFVQLGGASGAGKTTLCYAIAGIIPNFFAATLFGEVSIFGVDISKMSPQQRLSSVGLVTEDPIATLSGVSSTVEEEVALALYGQQLPHDQIIERTERGLRMFNILSLRDRQPSTLSGGQLVRTSLASIVAASPALYIIDDGLGHLDRLAMLDFFRYLQMETDSGKIVLFVSNDLAFGAEFANRLIFLEGGSLAFDGDPHLSWRNAAVKRSAIQNTYTEFYERYKTGYRRGGREDRPPITLSELSSVFQKIRQDADSK